MRRFCFATANLIVPCFAALSLFFSAQTVHAEETIDNIRNLLVQRGNFDGNFVNSVNSLLRQVDRDHNGIEQNDIDELVMFNSVTTRAQTISMILAYDVNGDFVVTRPEVERVLKFRSPELNSAAADPERLDRRVKVIMFGDANGDQKLEGAELAAQKSTAKDSDVPQNFAMKLASAMLKADPNADGRVTTSESLAILSKVAEGYEEALVKARSLKRSSGDNISAENCPAIKVPEKNKLIMLGTYDGASISTVSVAGQDQVTNVATLNIEPGEEQLTLVITSYEAMIWKFTGQTDRISMVYLWSTKIKREDGKTAAGVVGLPREKVSFLQAQNCLKRFDRPKSVAAIESAAVLARMASHEVDGRFGTKGAYVIELPSGKGSEKNPPPNLAGGKMIVQDNKKITVGESGELKLEDKIIESSEGLDFLKSELLRFSAGGVEPININEVVSDIKPEVYRVLPQQVGLLQLIGEEKIKPLGGNGYLVLQQINYPANLNDALRVKFIVSKGVPLPIGDPGSSCVFSEEEAKIVVGDGRCNFLMVE